MNSQVKKLTFTALMAAMITIFTAYICHIPVGQNGGYIHFGDSLIYIAACLLPWPYAMTAGSYRRWHGRFADRTYLGACNNHHKGTHIHPVYQQIR